MTTAELDALDALIAEKVMGWFKRLFHENYWWGPTIHEAEISVSNWRPTRDVALAILAAEKTGAIWHLFRRSGHAGKLRPPDYRVTIGYNGTRGIGTSEIPSLAICLALREAIEGEKP